MRNRQIARAGGFSLIEMITVIAVIGLIVAVTAPTLFSTLKANRLTAAGEELVNRISLAQQMAVSRNHDVELRFYLYSDPEAIGSAPHFRATMLFKPVVGTTTADPERLSDVAYLRSGVVIGNNSTLSPILAGGQAPDPDSEGVIQTATAQYKSILFRPDGSCSLSTFVPNQSYITLVDEQDFVSSGTVPNNFFAIQIDPYTSRCTTYRP